ncbi:hypothetical protein [Allokutzneria albata]|uniref:Uncharacterized protein n=1 Tax=Allokutzneria albata TaxID=211114 RepID=A0A1G9SUV5_ALLAB|nr:hypothetical protein [Allokutzneria albata]SDM39213.1 hypothetical protein SAMN04489726_1395 [Allokutzneria albata]
MSAVRSLVAVACAASAAVVALAAPAQAAPQEAATAWAAETAVVEQAVAAPPPWAPCGIGDPAGKLVRLYPNGAALRCGNESTGYRHILGRHLRDFEQMAFGTAQNWRDIAHLGIHHTMQTPERTKPQTGGKTCRSRNIILVNLHTNKEVGRKIVRVITSNTRNNDIITAYPAGSHC